jgi:hypothetical protein
MSLKSAAALLALSFATIVNAQLQKPEEAVREYFLALKARGLSEVADYMHPSELTRFKDLALPIFQAEAEAGQALLREATFGKGSSLDDVRKSDPRTFMANFMKLIGASAGIQPTFDAVEVLGALPEGQLMHVVTRTKVSSPPVSVTAMEVVSLKVHDGRWMLMLSGKLEGIAQALAARAKVK